MEDLIRKANLKDNVGDILGIELQIEIQGNLPFISMSQESGLGNETGDKDDPAVINYNRAIARLHIPAKTDSDFNPKLFDKDNSTRFSPVSIVGNIGESNSAYIFYDDKYKDLILVPELRWAGDTAKSKNYFNGKKICIAGWKIGGINGDFLDTMIGSTQYKRMNVDNPGIISNTSHKMVMQHSSSNTSTFDNFGVNLGNERYMESSRVATMNFVSFGSSAKFGGKVPAYRVVYTTLHNPSLIYIGLQELDDVLIPLPM